MVRGNSAVWPSAYYFSVMSFTVDASSVADSQTTETSHPHRIAPLSLRLSATTHAETSTHIDMKCLLQTAVDRIEML